MSSVRLFHKLNLSAALSFVSFAGCGGGGSELQPPPAPSIADIPVMPFQNVDPARFSIYELFIDGQPCGRTDRFEWSPKSVHKVRLVFASSELGTQPITFVYYMKRDYGGSRWVIASSTAVHTTVGDNGRHQVEFDLKVPELPGQYWLEAQYSQKTPVLLSQSGSVK